MLRIRTSENTMAKPAFGYEFKTDHFSADSNVPDQDEWAEMNAFEDYEVDLKLLN